MKPPKLDEIIRLMKVLDDLYCMYRLNDGLGFTFQVKQLSTGTNYRISVNPSIAYIEMLDKPFEGCTEFLYFDANTEPFTPEIWDDVRAIFPTRYPYWMASRGIRRASTGRLDMMAQTYPVLPADTSLESDIIDPIIFQNLTRYTMNEVLTQLIAVQIYPHRMTEFERDEKGFFSTMKLDYRVLDILSTEEILELIEVIETEIQERKDGTDNV